MHGSMCLIYGAQLKSHSGECRAQRRLRDRRDSLHVSSFFDHRTTDDRAGRLVFERRQTRVVGL